MGFSRQECWSGVPLPSPSHFRHVQLFVTPWTVVCQAPLPMGFSRQEYWSGLPCPPQGDLEKNMETHSSTLGKSHAWRVLVGYSPWGHEESDMTEWLHFHSSLSCIGAGNGNPLWHSCLENHRDREAWWASDCGVAQSWTRLKQLSSSSHQGIFPIQGSNLCLLCLLPW